MISTRVERDLQGWIAVSGSLRSPTRQQNQFTAEGNVRAEQADCVSDTPGNEIHARSMVGSELYFVLIIPYSTCSSFLKG